METMDVVESGFRWIHVVAGITWIGLLYFFNWVNSAFAPTMDAETKKKVVPELLPRALYWFRWGAAYTWVTGVVLLYLVFWRTGLHLESYAGGPVPWGVGPILCLLIVFGGTFVYDWLVGAQGPLKDNDKAFWGGIVLVAIIVILFNKVGGFGQRGYQIHLGAMFGTFMAFNVWFRIWPAQQRIIRATKNGEAPNPDDAGLAGKRSKHNTYMSVPLVFAMVNPHTPWVSSVQVAGLPLALPIVVAIGWGVTYMLYKKAAKVPGF